MSDYGIRISQPEYDAVSDTDDTHMMVTSKINNAKVVSVLSFNNKTNSGASFTYGSIAHGLTYVPNYTVMVQDDSSAGTWTPGGIFSNVFTGDYADSQYVYFSTEPGGTVSARFIILSEMAT